MSEYQADNPLIVQGDQTVLVEVNSPRYVEARDHLAKFAELIKSPEHIHTYRITPLSIWNATAAGVAADEIVETLRRSMLSTVFAPVSIVELEVLLMGGQGVGRAANRGNGSEGAFARPPR